MHIGMESDKERELSKPNGFTLLELMVVVTMIGVLTGIAVPSYERYIRNNERSAAAAQMLTLAGELERWRGKNLSYAGFVPVASYESASGTYGNMSILIPKGSTTTTFKYRILIMDSACRSTLNPVTPVAGCAGQGWLMIARPNSGDATDTAGSTGRLGSASRLVLNNQGVRCMTKGVAGDHIKDTDIGFNIVPPASPAISDASLCGTGSTAWR